MALFAITVEQVHLPVNPLSRPSGRDGDRNGGGGGGSGVQPMGATVSAADMGSGVPEGSMEASSAPGWMAPLMAHYNKVGYTGRKTYMYNCIRLYHSVVSM